MRILFLLLSFLTIASCHSLKEVTYSSEKGDYVLTVSFDTTVNQHKEVLSGRFTLNIFYGHLNRTIIRGKVWSIDRKASTIYLKSDIDCSDFMYYLIRQCEDCGDSTHSFKILTKGHQPLFGLDTISYESLLLELCDTIVIIDLSSIYGSRDTVLYFKPYCDTIYVVYKFWDRYYYYDYIAIGNTLGKETIIILNLDSLSWKYEHYVISTAFSLKGKRTRLCIWNCASHSIECITLKKKNKRKKNF